MKERTIYKQSDLVLKVNKNFDPGKLNLEVWSRFLDVLCGDREYQKKAIINSVIFLASGLYSSSSDLAIENRKANPILQDKYSSDDKIKKNLYFPKKLSANLDLATGTGKSYVIYGIAQIMLSLGVVEKVLVLCPSLTIEEGLNSKFQSLLGNQELKESLPDLQSLVHPRLVDGNSTVVKGDICVENVHAIYERTGSSIEDSFKNHGEQTLVINDESHHIYNKTNSYSKKWYEFLDSKEYGFKYIIGLSGTAFIDNEYFCDVIFRYSLREGIEERVIKNIEYVQKDDSSGIYEKFQKILSNHTKIQTKYSRIKPLTLFVTANIKSATRLEHDFREFLISYKGLTENDAKKLTTIITSHKDHKDNVMNLWNVDSVENKIQWIFSVSMLTEGWDVKNVFQIVPWEDRAFNSKLLISQVLGRGLRIPKEYSNPQPKVIVFNHDSWSSKIRNMVEEVLEIETRITSNAIVAGSRLQYHFALHNIDYTKEEQVVEKEQNSMEFNLSRMFNEGIKLESQVITTEMETEFESVTDPEERKETYIINHKAYTIEEVTEKILNEFSIRDWEGKILKINTEIYSQENLPTFDMIYDLISKSMKKVGIDGLFLNEKNRNIILQSFSTFLRKSRKSIKHITKTNNLLVVETKKINKESMSLSNFRKESTIFYSTDWNNEVNEDEKDIFKSVIEDESLPKSAEKEVNVFKFRTPLDLVFTSHKPERDFVREMIKDKNYKNIDSWIKSRDIGFYIVPYSIRYGGLDSKSRKYKQSAFNPDFFLKSEKDGKLRILVIEIKADGDNSIENKAKYKYGKQHFKELNSKLKSVGVNEEYFFHFLSPNGYSQFFEYLDNGTIFKDQQRFRCELENLLEQ